MADRLARHISLPREIAVEKMLERCTLKPTSQQIPLTDALGRVCAQDVRSKNTLPNTLTSQWDGIAVHYRDFAGGMPDTSAWEKGREYVFCNTGIGIEGDYDTVMRIECVSFDEAGRIQIAELPQRGQCTIPVGSRMRAGDLLIEANTILTPLGLSILVMGGFDTVIVLRKPIVAFIPSGGELIPMGRMLPPGKNAESNSIMLHGKLLQWGAEPLIYPIVPDDFGQLTAAMEDASSKADIVIINAGSSKGTDDFTVEALESIGTVICHEVDHGPGKHTSYTVGRNGVPIVGLSGPPLGAEPTADWYVKPLVDRFLNQPPASPPKIKALLTADAFSGKTVPFIMRVFAQRKSDGSYVATPLPVPGGPNMAQADRANGFLRIPPNGSGLRSGDCVEIELRYPYTFF